MSGHQSGTGIPAQPARLGGAASGGGGFPADAVQIIAYDPAGGDVERAWRIKNLHDYAPVGSAVARGPFSLAFDTAGLVNGVSFYTPTIGDLLLDAWIEIDTLWDGTTPKIDFGTFVGSTTGIFKAVSQALAADNGLASEAAGTGFKRTSSGAVPYSMQSGAGYSGSQSGMGVFTAANPLKVVVSQTGAAGGADPGSSQGAARIYIVTATPAAL